ncbi:outer membrane protein assembly factor BamC [Rheinheimera sp. MMS21-TC3]|uniref:outer membrane protein assembly factor BamC n=1 Tax=Rheinheimera sp. MMS21-TC3 TaxID=3072790 RepID=UPI0028C48A29|nr:outer membrane protein assembly factor BamC [Rheinheimera sp. MMS21-TC3]WNO60804.1 outer membrane protein assembly factor BamC [Rheinheimera sp. MMS21-TC3]
MHYLAKSGLALVLCLNGCSVLSVGQQQDRNASKVAAELKIPTGLQQPAKPGQFDIPTTKATVSHVSEKPPVLVLATAASSRVEEGEKQAKVRFDRTDVSGDLVDFLQRMIQVKFAEQNIALTAVDDENLIFTTDWISSYQEDGFWLWSSTNLVDRARFTIILDPKPHGRSANLSVKMLEYEYFNTKAKLTANDSHREETALLNSIIDRIGKEEIVLAQLNRNKVPEVNLEPGLDGAGNAVLITPQKIDITWSQLETLFEALNLEVTDRDRSKHTYFLRYIKPTAGLWSTFWGSKTLAELPLSDNEEYQLVLAKYNTGTAITLNDKAGNALSPEMILSIYQPFVEAIQKTKVEL